MWKEMGGSRLKWVRARVLGGWILYTVEQSDGNYTNERTCKVVYSEQERNGREDQKSETEKYRQRRRDRDGEV